jgi:cell shape-determining protein MreC
MTEEQAAAMIALLKEILKELQQLNETATQQRFQLSRLKHIEANLTAMEKGR